MSNIIWIKPIAAFTKIGKELGFLNRSDLWYRIVFIIPKLIIHLLPDIGRVDPAAIIISLTKDLGDLLFSVLISVDFLINDEYFH
jgi:hypothetical protein